MNQLKLILSAAVSLCGLMLSGCGKAPTKLVLHEVHIEGYPTTLADHEFSRLVDEKTVGRIQIEVHSGSEFYQTETEVIEALKKGGIAFARISIAPLTEYAPSVNILQLPFLYRDSEHLKEVLTGEIGQFFLESIKEQVPELTPLCFYDAGVRSFYTKKRIESLADLQNMRIRVMDSPMMMEMVNLLGGIGVRGIGPTNVYSNLLNGTIDGAENNCPTYESMGDYLAAPFFNLDQHMRIPDLLIASTKALDSLPEKDRKAIKECALKTQAYEFEQWKIKEVESENFIRESGNVITEYTQEQKKEFEDKVQPLYEKYGKGYEEIIKQIKEL